MDITKYLRRINYTGELKPTLKVLQNLQKAHLLLIPFENLDIIKKIPIELEIKKLFNKIILHNRGGFCYELNGLFFHLLNTIGFKVKMVSARVYNSDNGYGVEFDHMAIIARIDGVEYLTDVGFGEFAFEPLKIELDTILKDKRGMFKIENYDLDHLLVSKYDTDEWLPEYIFSLQSRELKEYEPMCYYHQSSPDSHFTRKRICSLPTEDGRITISGNSLKLTRGDNHKETEIKNEADLKKLLQKYFNMEL